MPRDAGKEQGAAELPTAGDGLFRALADQAFDLVMVADATGITRYANKAFARILGYDPAELVGASPAEIAHPDDLPSLVSVIEEVSRAPGATGTLDYRVRHRNGSFRWMQTVGKNLFDEPSVRGFLITMHDITDQRLTAEALRESEERFRLLAENASDVIFLSAGSHPAAGFAYVSPALERLTGYTPEEACADPHFVDTLIHPDDRERLGGPDPGNPTEPDLVRWVCKDGRVLWTETILSPIFDEDGELLIVQGIARDVTQREHDRALLHEQNELLLQADEYKNELISIVSHDIRTPLTSIMGYLELVLDEDVDTLTPEQRRLLEIAKRNADRLLALVKDLLFISKTEAGQLELELHEADLAEMAAEVVEAQQPNAAQIGVKLRLTSEPSPTLVDRTRVAELLENLLSNALKFTPAGGSVEVRVSPGDGVGVLEVADTGLGIAVADQQHLFERFFRSKRTEKVPGIGLGLAIVKGIVDAHRGRITVESSMGKGTTFRVELPVEQEPAETQPDA